MNLLSMLRARAFSWTPSWRWKRKTPMASALARLSKVSARCHWHGLVERTPVEAELEVMPIFNVKTAME